MSQGPATPLRPAPANEQVKYLRPVEPLFFPSEAQVPETTLHLVLRTFLFQLLRFVWGSEVMAGSDQFVYWHASDPKTCLAPDAFLKLGRPFEHFDSWKTWERGTPELAVEILSDSDRALWDDKLQKYQDLGVRELVCFDPEASPNRRLRIWDRVSDDLVERALEGGSARSQVLKLDGIEVFWVLGNVEGTSGLRLSRDAAGARLVLSEQEAEAEARQAEAEARQAEAEARQAEAEARHLAEARVRELEAELKRLRG